MLLFGVDIFFTFVFTIITFTSFGDEDLPLYIAFAVFSILNAYFRRDYIRDQKNKSNIQAALKDENQLMRQDRTRWEKTTKEAVQQRQIMDSIDEDVEELNQLLKSNHIQSKEGQRQ